ncbi:MAG: hypothetical protein HQL45_15055 [Alphaproteobacteria bacterium]|nr:hypothetical protein [Alphaproteobacteria bacterium]
MSAVDWATIHSRPLVSVPGCWRVCNGFCCANNHPDMRFRLIPGGGKGTTVIYLEDEYQWLKANGHVICGEEKGGEIQLLSFDFGGPRPIQFRTAPCALMGQCNDICTKPLLCRTYPFLPVFGCDGEIEELLPASILDATLTLKEGRDPCPLAKDQALFLKALESEPELSRALRHPYLILVSQAVKAFMTSYQSRLKAWDGFNSLSGTAFWQGWEMQYLGRRLVDREAVAAHLRHIHADLSKRFGDVLA